MTIIPSDAPPATGVHRVGDLKPDLLLTQEHHMCPGCGEPLAIRIVLETLVELGLAERCISVVGIGCYTSFSGSLDVDRGGNGKVRLSGVHLARRRRHGERGPARGAPHRRER